MIENSQPDGGYVLSYGGKRIPFRIEYRKRKKLAITVHPEMRLQVVAPIGKTREQVLPRVDKRAAWILKQWRYFERFLPRHPGPRFVSGETHVYLGRQYRLRVERGGRGGCEADRQILVRLDQRSPRCRPRAAIARLLVPRACRTSLPVSPKYLPGTMSVAEAGTRTQTHNSQDVTPLGELHKGRKRAFERRPGESSGPLHRLRDRARTLSPANPQPQPGVLPVIGGVYARLGKEEKTTRAFCDLNGVAAMLSRAHCGRYNPRHEC